MGALPPPLGPAPLCTGYFPVCPSPSPRAILEVQDICPLEKDETTYGKSMCQIIITGKNFAYHHTGEGPRREERHFLQLLRSRANAYQPPFTIQLQLKQSMSILQSSTDVRSKQRTYSLLLLSSSQQKAPPQRHKSEFGRLHQGWAHSRPS